MFSKTALVLGLGAGYVLGTRDGRERYEQIKTQANRLWNDPKVQKKAAQARDKAKQKAPKIQEKVSGAAHQASSKGKQKSSSDPETIPPLPGAVPPTATTSGDLGG